MRILYVNTTVYDYSTATLIEGLTSLGHELRSTERSNYATALPDRDVAAFAETADLIVIGSNMGVRYELVRQIRNPRIVYVDGSDFQSINPPTDVRFKAIFKRELGRALPDPPAKRIHPLPFAAERRYFASKPVEKDIAVSFVANLSSNPLRYSIYQRLLNCGRREVVAGSTGERSYDGLAPEPMETPVYREILHRSRVGISAPGNGYDCARYWEVLASGAMLLTWDLDIVIPNGFSDGVDCMSFRSLDEFNEKLAFCFSHPDAVAEIAARGWERLHSHHTSEKRAAAFLDRACMEVARPGFWTA